MPWSSESIRFRVIRSVTNSTLQSTIGMIATFVATLVIPLQQAVVLGVILAAMLYIYCSSSDIRIDEVKESERGISEIEPPKDLPSDAVIGEANVFVATSIFGESTRAAFDAGNAWLATFTAEQPGHGSPEA